MAAQYRVVVIGGGVVGASVLYHLAKFGWTDAALVERSVREFIVRRSAEGGAPPES